MQIRSITCSATTPYLVELAGINFLKFSHNTTTINVADNRNMNNSFTLENEVFIISGPFRPDSQIWITGSAGTEILGIMMW